VYEGTISVSDGSLVNKPKRHFADTQTCIHKILSLSEYYLN